MYKHFVELHKQSIKLNHGIYIFKLLEIPPPQTQTQRFISKRQKKVIRSTVGEKRCYNSTPVPSTAQGGGLYTDSAQTTFVTQLLCTHMLRIPGWSPIEGWLEPYRDSSASALTLYIRVPQEETCQSS